MCASITCFALCVNNLSTLRTHFIACYPHARSSWRGCHPSTQPPPPPRRVRSIRHNLNKDRYPCVKNLVSSCVNNLMSPCVNDWLSPCANDLSNPPHAVDGGAVIPAPSALRALGPRVAQRGPPSDATLGIVLAHARESRGGGGGGGTG